MKDESVEKPSKESPVPLLNKLRRNGIFKAIQTAELDPSEFDLNNSGGEARVKHKWSESFFIIDGQPGHYAGRFVVGDTQDWTYEAHSWDALMLRFGHWLTFVKLDLDTPDLWAELRRETKLLEAAADELIENTPFTPDEQKAIATRLDALAKNMSHTHSLSAAQMRALGKKIDYLIDASSRLGRKDWLNAFIGAIFGAIVGMALAPESAGTLFRTFLRAIGLLYPELPMD